MISRPQLLQTHLLGAQPPEPEASERGEDDGDSGADDEHESSSPAASGLTCNPPSPHEAVSERGVQEPSPQPRLHLCPSPLAAFVDVARPKAGSPHQGPRSAAAPAECGSPKGAPVGLSFASQARGLFLEETETL